MLFNSFNAAVVNRINLNDDGILPETAMAIYKNFINKFCDLEHERSNIVGFIINSGLSEFGTNRLISEEEALASNAPFNIALSSVVWSVADPHFSDLLVESSDETSPHYQEISASWEIGFDDMYLAIGSKDLTQAEIVKDPKHIAELKKHLRAYSGTGSTDKNEPIYRVIAGDALPLGIGYTTSPAAAVKGVVVIDSKPIDLLANKDEKAAVSVRVSCESLHKAGEAAEDVSKSMAQAIRSITQENIIEIENIQKNNSQDKPNTVNNSSIMKITNIEDITDESIKELSAAAVKNFVGKHIADQIDEVSTRYAQNLEAKEQEIKERNEAAKAMTEELENAKKQMEVLAEQIKQAEEARLAEKAQADFNARMADLESKFEIGEKELGVIAKSIRGLDEAAYADKLNDLEILLAGRAKKAADEEKEDEDKKKESSKASFEEVLDETKAGEDKLPPNTPSVQQTVGEEFAEAFKLEDFKIRLSK